MTNYKILEKKMKTIFPDFQFSNFNEWINYIHNQLKAKPMKEKSYSCWHPEPPGRPEVYAPEIIKQFHRDGIRFYRCKKDNGIVCDFLADKYDEIFLPKCGKRVHGLYYKGKTIGHNYL